MPSPRCSRCRVPATGVAGARAGCRRRRRLRPYARRSDRQALHAAWRHRHDARRSASTARRSSSSGSLDRDGKLTDVVLGYPKARRLRRGRRSISAPRSAASRIESPTGRSRSTATRTRSRRIGRRMRCTAAFAASTSDVWTAHRDSASGMTFTYTSADGEEGYPGHVARQCRATRSPMRNELRIDYTATTDKPTPINFTNHSFFNLAGAGTMLDHVLMINAHRYTPMNDVARCRQARSLPVAGTPLDFTTPHRIGERDRGDARRPNGLRSQFRDRSTGGSGSSLAARLEEPTSGRVLEIWTTEPGMQFFTGNRFDGSFPGVGGSDLSATRRRCARAAAFSRRDQSSGLAVGRASPGRDIPIDDRVSILEHEGLS